MAAEPGIVFAIDATNQVHVDFHGFGEATADRFLRRVERLARERNPLGIVLAFDPRGPTFRHEVFPEYKAGRGERDPEIARQLDKAKELAIQRGMQVECVTGYEADDVLATVARMATDAGHKAVLVSRDKDIRQCLRSGHVNIVRKWSSYDGRTEMQWYTAADLEAEYGLSPTQWPEFQALVGQPGDNIGGAHHIGPKRAADLLQAYRDLDGIMANIWSVKGRKTRDGLFAFKSKILEVMNLVTLKTSMPLDWSIEQSEPAT